MVSLARRRSGPGLSALCALLPGERLPRWVVLGPALGYLVSVTLLLISGGSNPTIQSSTGGLAVLVLLPVLGMALYYTVAYSAVVIAASVACLAIAGAATQATMADDVLRVFLWTAVTVVVSVTIHRLRQNLEGEARESAELARVGHLVNGATQSLTSLHDPRDVIAEGTRVMAELAGADGTRTSYAQVRDGVVSEQVVVDDLGSDPESWLERDDPYVSQAVSDGVPLATPLERTAMGPTRRAVVDRTAAVHAAFLPVAPEGSRHGIVILETRHRPISEEVFSRCRAFGTVVELALGNALTHQALEVQAHTDPLTGLANRRGLALYLDGDGGSQALAVLVLDIDGLKDINDVHGHEVGDAVLVAVAKVTRSKLRECDLLARTGGDEFVAVIEDADESDARRVALRLQRAIAVTTVTTVHGVRASVSIGHAYCPPGGDVDLARQRADQSMYEAKLRGHRHHGERHRAVRAGRAVASESTTVSEEIPSEIGNEVGSWVLALPSFKGVPSGRE